MNQKYVKKNDEIVHRKKTQALENFSFAEHPFAFADDILLSSKLNQLQCRNNSLIYNSINNNIFMIEK